MDFLLWGFCVLFLLFFNQIHIKRDEQGYLKSIKSGINNCLLCSYLATKYTKLGTRPILDYLRADADTDISEQENSHTQYICQYIILSECGYLILVKEICNGDRISNILTNFIPNSSAGTVNTSFIAYWIMDCPLLDKLRNYTILNHLSKFFDRLKKLF